ncbi:hypothetical protein G647_03941 [Cladophialophora carrionii CBS 160.54]|uniref:Uncharacterized protein n=1 Tax=Cladophialophora carrionii CBS 160.54 TaxID=1279043 RepID=V9DF39_9EURO|nr:uncharacterized protein G647_03941 [Cladophialophora carrionii CBS 160.54]ETI24572.1 hypothetical protein G647_03941 [Cladophialophora carrionii CBS 160.54]
MKSSVDLGAERLSVLVRNSLSSMDKLTKSRREQ